MAPKAAGRPTRAAKVAANEAIAATFGEAPITISDSESQEGSESEEEPGTAGAAQALIELAQAANQAGQKVRNRLL